MLLGSFRFVWRGSGGRSSVRETCLLEGRHEKEEAPSMQLKRKLQKSIEVYSLSFLLGVWCAVSGNIQASLEGLLA